MSDDAISNEVNRLMKRSVAAFEVFKKMSLQQRKDLLEQIAVRLEEQRESLIAMASEESHLPPARLATEFDRTCFQLRSYGQAAAEGSWLDVRIDTKGKLGANAGNPATTSDLRKTMVPLGPVAVFGASNFPFAYSTAGGDTAGALASGNTVVIKGHPAHARTSRTVAELIRKAASDTGLDPDICLHLEGEGFAPGKYLVQHPDTAAVGFTGSLSGGRALMDSAAARKIPIPVFAEMGSTNPIFILPGSLIADPEGLAALCADSILQSVGQFCTNPGLMVAIASQALEKFTQKMTSVFDRASSDEMLNEGIAEHYFTNRKKILETAGVGTLAVPQIQTRKGFALPTLATVKATEFIRNPDLHEEVFGPFSMLIVCKDESEMLSVAHALTGQLTCTLHGTDEEISSHTNLTEVLTRKCGRLVRNGVPTGVQVAWAMHHGGPYPACSDSRFTAVGPDNLKRFSRPVCYQNWHEPSLPPELRNSNPLGIWRTVNGTLTKDPLP